MTTSPHGEAFGRWLTSLEARYLADLTFPELSRALRALSSTYVERRHRLDAGAALDGAGKRAAFALFYGPLHYLLVREIVHALPGAIDPAASLVDLGCGTGASGAAWAAACRTPPVVLGVDRHPWVLTEAAHTYREFGVNARVRRAEVDASSLPRTPALMLAAFTLNELATGQRDALLARAIDLVAHAPSNRRRGTRRLLVVEPLAGRAAPWWSRWRQEIIEAGGRADEWRVRVELPPIVAKLDRAAGLNHNELTGRTLWI